MVHVLVFLYLIDREVWIVVLTAIAIKVGCHENRPGKVWKIESILKYNYLFYSLSRILTHFFLHFPFHIEPVTVQGSSR